jgi:competence protein ComGC
MKDNMHNRILSGETTYKDAHKFRIMQALLYILVISIVVLLVIK